MTAREITKAVCGTDKFRYVPKDGLAYLVRRTKHDLDWSCLGSHAIVITPTRAVKAACPVCAKSCALTRKHNLVWCHNDRRRAGYDQ
jgi:hypothetical protein